MAKATASAPTIQPTASMVEKVKRIDALNSRKDKIDAEVKQLRDELLVEVIALKVKTIPVTIGARTFKVTKVEPKGGVIIDEVALRNALGEKDWLKVSTRTLDTKKLEANIASGEVDANKVSECSVEKEPSAPYIKITS